MGNGIGERTLWTSTFGRSIQVLANAQGALWKTGGVTMDWTDVPAVGANATTYYTGDVVAGGKVTFEDNVQVLTGEKVLRYGSVIYKKVDGTYALATDATGALVKGETFVVNETWLEEDLMSNHPGVLDAGKVFKARLLVGGAGQPTLAGFNTAMPGILFAD